MNFIYEVRDWLIVNFQPFTETWLFKVILILLIISSVCTIIKGLWKLGVFILILVFIFGGGAISINQYVQSGWETTKDFANGRGQDVQDVINSIDPYD